MRYQRRELRAVNVFALSLVGIGLLLGTIGLIVWADTPTADEHKVTVVKATPVAAGRWKGKAEIRASSSYAEARALANMIGGLCFVCLGLTLNVGLRRVIRNGGEDVADPLAEPSSTAQAG